MHKINYKGKDYIGQIVKVEAIFSQNCGRSLDGKWHDREIMFYKVKMLPENEPITIDDIIIYDFDEIKNIVR